MVAKISSWSCNFSHLSRLQLGYISNSDHVFNYRKSVIEREIILFRQKMSALGYFFFLCAIPLGLQAQSVPIPSPRPITIYDLEIKVGGQIPVLENKRGGKERQYRPKPGVESHVKILESRRGMYLMEIYEDGKKLSGEYLISQKWAEKILEIDAILSVARMNDIIKKATTPIAGVDCPPGTEKEAEAAPSDAKQERFKRAFALEIDESLKSALNSDANQARCIKNAAQNSQLSPGLYDALTSVMSLKGCSEKILSIRSHIPSKAAYAVEPISSCAVELNFLTNDQEEGELLVELESGEKVPLSWKSASGSPIKTDAWLFEQGYEPGFLAQEGFKKICPELALDEGAARLVKRKRSPIVLRGKKEQVADTEDKNEEEVQTSERPESLAATVSSDEKVEAAPADNLTLTASTVDKLNEERAPTGALTRVPIPKPRPANLGQDRVNLPLESVPRPRARPENIVVPEEKAQNATSSRPLCQMSGVSAQWVRNCEQLYRAGIPKDALEYALKVMKLNDDSFESDKCYRTASSGHYSMRGVSKSAFASKMRSGLPNKCQMVINDTRDKQGAYRGRMYYIDLCTGSRARVTKSYFNMGTGTFKNNYADTSGAHTTVKGAFFTNYKSFSFQKNNAAYKNVKARVKKLSGTYKAPAVQLFGLSTTNNSAGPNLKYMHVSGYKSSWGCPSIAPDNYWMIEKLANNGPSLVLNYGTGMEDINKCSK